ncbi:hypothetical protein EYV94_13985 [Puteibacter caeruleilacunae]|nr:hypothetical protein EYV94_13985 [Puteibacter caeruleilacunae]
MKALFFQMMTAIILLAGCTINQSKIVVDKTAKEVFNQQELEGIIAMIQLVDKRVMEETNKTDINQAYHKYFEDMIQKTKHTLDVDLTLIKDTVKFKFFDSLDRQAVQAIWSIDNHKEMIRTRDTILYDLHGYMSLGISPIGSYCTYMKKIGETDEKYRHYHNSISAAGDISPSLITYFPSKHLEYDFTLFKDRLWATVFLLRFGDPMEQKIERYLTQQKKK